MHNMKSFLCLIPLLLVWSFLLVTNRNMKEVFHDVHLKISIWKIYAIYSKR